MQVPGLYMISGLAGLEVKQFKVNSMSKLVINTAH